MLWTPGIACANHGPSSVTIALTTRTEPATRRAARVAIKGTKRRDARDVRNIAGSVPRPNAAIVIAPCTADCWSVATSSTLYTNPHGIQPQTMPKAQARGRELIGSNRRPSGASRRQTA